MSKVCIAKGVVPQQDELCRHCSGIKAPDNLCYHRTPRSKEEAKVYKAQMEEDREIRAWLKVFCPIWRSAKESLIQKEMLCPETK